MGTYSILDKYNDFNSSSVFEIAKEDANNYLVRLPISNQIDRYKSQWRFKVINTAFHIAGLDVIDLNGFVSDLQFMDDNSTFENVFRLGIAGNTIGSPVNAFDEVGGVHGNQNQTAGTLELDGVDITTLSNGTSAFGEQLIIAQTIELLNPNDSAVAAISTMTHTVTKDQIRADVSRVFNTNSEWEIFTDYVAMLPSFDSATDTIQVEGLAAILANKDDDNWYLTGEQATWLQLSDTAHNYIMRMDLPYGGPNLTANWGNSGTLTSGFIDRSDNTNKGYVINISIDFTERVNVSGTTIVSRTDYTLTK